MDSEGNERSRLEGYLPRDEFAAWLEMGLARAAFMKKEWADAESHLDNVLNAHSNSVFVPEAIYYRGVSRYSVSHDSTELAKTANTLNENFPGHEWQLRSIPWLKEKSESMNG